MLDREKVLHNTKTLMETHPKLRYGQAVFITMAESYTVCMDLAGKDCDCFHDDKKVDLFLDKCEEKISQ